jgi:hypothetical protein
MPVTINIPNTRTTTDWGVVSTTDLSALGLTNLGNNSGIYPNLSIGCSSKTDLCEYENIVLADLGNSSSNYNDRTSILQGRLGTNPTIFTLQKEGVDVAVITDNTYGTYYPNGDAFFSGNNDYAGFIIEWREVLNAFGQGCYTLKIEWDNLGTYEEAITQCYKLHHYNNSLAEGTVAFEWEQNGEIYNQYFVFKDFTWPRYLRVTGFFGFNQPKYEETNVVRSNRQIEQVEDRVVNSYEFESYLIPQYVTKQIWYDMALANKIWVTDYNFYNHDQEIAQKPIRVVEFGEAEYFGKSRKARIGITFGDRADDTIKRERF